MTVTQTIDIPVDHRVFFEFLAPREIPAGKTRVEVKLMPVVEKQDKPVLKNTEEDTSPKSHSDALSALFSQPTPLADSLLGALSDAGDISLEQIRDERLAKYLE
jgi:hypothetical protein